ncbi:NYN domain-containing protein [Clostridia bacterium]|nr:NYN domain-containing protein [Clostridia bacterium]
MQRVMVFIDFENFNIAAQQYYESLKKRSPRLDYNIFPRKLVEKLPGEQNRLIKTFLFAPKPDDFLMQDSRRAGTYKWIDGMKNQRYFTVIEGRHVARPIEGASMNINDKSTYFVEEKGTDVNMAAHMITKGFLNAYDTAVVMSGDTDYIPTLEILNTIGKTTVCVGVQSQNMERFRKTSDDIILLDESFFNNCLRP